MPEENARQEGGIYEGELLFSGGFFYIMMLKQRMIAHCQPDQPESRQKGRSLWIIYHIILPSI